MASRTAHPSSPCNPVARLPADCPHHSLYGAEGLLERGRGALRRDLRQPRGFYARSLGSGRAPVDFRPETSRGPEAGERVASSGVLTRAAPRRDRVDSPGRSAARCGSESIRFSVSAGSSLRDRAPVPARPCISIHHGESFAAGSSQNRGAGQRIPHRARDRAPRLPRLRAQIDSIGIERADAGRLQHGGRDVDE